MPIGTDLPIAAIQAIATTLTTQQARVLQGRYMGSLRTLPRDQQAKVKALRVSTGIEAAIKLAQDFKRKSA